MTGQILSFSQLRLKYEFYEKLISYLQGPVCDLARELFRRHHEVPLDGRGGAIEPLGVLLQERVVHQLRGQRGRRRRRRLVHLPHRHRSLLTPA